MIERTRWLAVACWLLLSGAVLIPGLDGARADEPKKPADTKPAADVTELRKKLAEALKMGNDAEAQRLFEQIERALRGEKPVEPPVRPNVEPKPPREPEPSRELPRNLGDKKLRDEYQRQMQKFDEIIKGLEDEGARKQLEKTRDEYRKAMEEELRKAEKSRDLTKPPQANPDPVLQPGGRPLRLGIVYEKPSPALIDHLDLPQGVGLIVVNVVANSAAEKAGILKHDILLQFAGKEVPTDHAKFNALVAGLKSGGKFETVVIRKGKKETLSGIELPENRRVETVEGPWFGAPRTRVELNGGDFSLRTTLDGVEYFISGELLDGKVKTSSIVVVDGKDTIKAETLDKVPVKYRDKCEKIANSLRGLSNGDSLRK